MNIELTRTELRVLMNALTSYTSKLKNQKLLNLVTNSDLQEVDAL